MTLLLIIYALLTLVGLLALGPVVVVPVVILVKVAKPRTRRDGFHLLRTASRGALVVGLVGGGVVTGTCALVGHPAIEDVVGIFVCAALSGFGWAGALEVFLPG